MTGQALETAAGILKAAAMIGFGYLVLVAVYVALEWILFGPKRKGQRQ